MPSGGARNRSGPQADPKSGRSDARGFKLSALPNQGFEGVVPEFPLPAAARYEWEYEDKRRFRVFSQELTDLYRDREVAVWEDCWTTPQACAWSLEAWRWSILGEYCRLKSIVELEADANAALVGQLHRYRDQLGLTPAGLKDNGWAIASDEVAAKRDEPAQVTTPTRRLRAVVSE